MKNKLAEPITKKFRDYVDNNAEYKYNARYNGVVEDNNDPQQMGRCKIRVMGLYDNIPTEMLTWALPDFSFVGGIKGSFVVPENGTVVNVYFDDGDIYQPRYFSKTMDLKNMDFEADKSEDYPNSMIFWETSKGDFTKFNRLKGEYTFKTHTGVFVKVFQSGNIEITNDSTDVGDVSLNLRGNFNITNPFGNINIFTNNFNLSGFGDMNIVTNGSSKISSLNNTEISVNGNCDIIAGGETKITAKDKCTIESLECNITSNKINFDVATGPTNIVDVEGVPNSDAITKSSKFEMNVGTEISVPLMTVVPSVQGGPFNSLMFDPLTGALHQGRHVESVGTVIVDNTKKQLELARQTQILLVQQQKEISEANLKIFKKYNSITETTKMAIAGPAGVAFTQKKMADEILASTESITESYKLKIADLEQSLGNNLTSPVFGTKIDLTSPQGKQSAHSLKIPGAKILAETDPTSKTTYYDLIGPSGGFHNMDGE